MVEKREVICWKCRLPFETFNWDVFKTCPECLPVEHWVTRMYLCPEDFGKLEQGLVYADFAKWEKELVL